MKRSIKLSAWEIGVLLGTVIVLPFIVKNNIESPDQILAGAITGLLIAFMPRIWRWF